MVSSIAEGIRIRAEQLNVSNRYIAYFGALMRQYTPGVGREIQTWFSSLSEHEQLEHQAVFVRQLAETKVTPSFKPTVLLTLLDVGRSVADALTIFTQINLNAMQIYTAAVEAKQIPATTILMASLYAPRSKRTLIPVLLEHQTRIIRTVK